MNDDALWRAFSEQTLSSAEWNHRAHLRVAWMHLARWELDEAHLRLRAGILRLNVAHGLEETPARGYHETLTRLWLACVAAARDEAPASDSARFLERHAELLDKEHALRFYTRDLLFSVRARSLFVPPDRDALPR